MTSRPSPARRAARHVVPFALVGVAAVGLVGEQTERPSDDLRGVLLVAAGALVGALVAIGHGRLARDKDRASGPSRAWLGAWTVVRLFLAFEMTRYGLAKLVGMQFYPRYYQLDTRALDLHPMSLAWAFFGRRYGYQAFAGVAEVSSAVLLVFRRTATLGACVLCAVMANVVVLDFDYDIPVRLFASVYLVMAIFVASIDARRLWTFFLGDGPTPPRAYLDGSSRSRWPVIAGALALVIPTGDILHHATKYRVFRRDLLEGLWRVDGATGIDGVLPYASTWEKVYFEKGNQGTVRSGTRRYLFRAEVDEGALSVRLHVAAESGHADETIDASFTLDGARLHLEGAHAGRPFTVDLTREFPR